VALNQFKGGFDMKRLSLAMMATGLLLPVFAHAGQTIMASAGGQPSYTYIEGGYMGIEPDNGELEPDGYSIRGSYALGAWDDEENFVDHIFLAGHYSSLEDEFGGGNRVQIGNNGGTTVIVNGSRGGDLEIDLYGASVGWKSALGKNSSWHASVDYLNVESDLDFDGVNIFDDDDAPDDDAFGASAGVRGNVLGPYLEVGAQVNWLDADWDDVIALTAYGMFRVTENIGLRAEGTVDDEDNVAYLLGVRYSF
jgi:hypothetical protein